MLVVLLVFVFCDISAMKRKNKKQVSKECYLLRMPIDIQNLIAQYLMETEKEFVLRTMREEYELMTISLPRYVIHECTLSCPENTKTIKFDVSNCFQETLHMIVRDETEGKDTTIDYDNGFPVCFALSQKGQFCAALINCSYEYIPKNWKKYLWETRINRNNKKRYFFNVLRVTNIQTKAAQERPINFELLTCVAFNKQGTHLIVHGEKKSADLYQIFPLKMGENKPILKNADTKDTNLLHYYLREKGVCKTIKNEQ